MGFIGNRFLKKYVNNYWGLKNEQSNLWFEYLSCLFNLPISTSACIYDMLSFPNARFTLYF